MNLIDGGTALPSWIVLRDEVPAACRHFGARDAGWTNVVIKS